MLDWYQNAGEAVDWFLRWLRYCADIIRGLAKVWDWSETDGQGIELVAEIK